MNDEQYLKHCRALLADFSRTLATRTSQLDDEHPLRELALAFSALDDNREDWYERGSTLVVRLFETYPEFAPTFPRDLLWFFGGDCLHYMPDEEIAVHQQLEDSRRSAAARGEILDLGEYRAKLLNLQ